MLEKMVLDEGGVGPRGEGSGLVRGGQSFGWGRRVEKGWGALVEPYEWLICVG
ncbi:hypothetical protein [Bartonella sp. AS69XJJH]|uniref:hypothetical protein n=1 Tax=Bartonella sp. AS69XJJH TaxID=3243508 RepID=UPI0035D0B1F3